jgi:hypothetical protein
VIVLAQQRGASRALIGVMFVFLGVSALLGSVAAPFLLVAPEAIAIGLLYGAMFFLHPTWASTAGAYRLMLTPDAMQGRVASSVWLLWFGVSRSGR